MTERIADTVVLSHIVHAAHGAHESMLPQDRPEILEKPTSKADNMRMLLDLQGAACEVVTGVSLGAYLLAISHLSLCSYVCSVSNPYRPGIHNKASASALS